jgi:hypothetical protein
MEHERIAATIALNKALIIVKLNGEKFLAELGYYQPKGFALKHPTLGFVSFDGKYPYALKRKSTQQEILDDGGFVSYEGMSFVKEWTK